MSNYFVLGFRKIKTIEEYKNKIAGHNHRNRDYPNRSNIDTSKSKNNIVLQKLKYKSARELINSANQKIKEENEKIKERNESVTDKKQKEKLKRGLKKGSSFAFEILVDCSKIPGWQESNYIEYLKEAEKWLKDKFQGQEVISSIIHLDEGKPHLHITFSYFNKDLKKWNQRGLKEQNLTNLNILLKDFERDIGKKYGLKKGDNKDIKKQINVNAGKYFNDKIETYKIKESLFTTKEVKAISVNNINKCLTTYYNKIIKKVNQKIPQIGEIERLKEELLKTKKEVEKVKEIAKKETEEKYKKHIAELTKALNNNLEQELIQELNKQHKHIQELNKKLKEKENIINKKNIQIQELQAKIKELMPEKKDKNYSIGGIGL